METTIKDIDVFIDFIRKKYVDSIIEKSTAHVLATIPTSLSHHELKAIANSALFNFFSYNESAFNSIDNKEIIDTTPTTSPLINGYILALVEIEQKKALLNYLFEFTNSTEELKNIHHVISDFYTTRQKQSIIQFYANYLIQAEELNKREEELNSFKKNEVEFIYTASHDLQEPLRMVTSYLQLLAVKYQDKLDAQANEFIHFALDGSLRMKNLLSSLLEFSRLNNTYNFKTVNTNSIVTLVINNLSDQIKIAKATITYTDLPIINGDSGLINKLFTHLISNAIKFRGKEKAPQINITAKKTNQGYQFSIQDNGIGINKEYTEKIFFIFQRLHPKHAYAGSGIGLAVCKKIIEIHGGKIWVEAELGKGSTFYFTINNPIT